MNDCINPFYVSFSSTYIHTACVLRLLNNVFSTPLQLVFQNKIYGRVPNKSIICFAVKKILL